MGIEEASEVGGTGSKALVFSPKGGKELEGRRVETFSKMGGRPRGPSKLDLRLPAAEEVGEGLRPLKGGGPRKGKGGRLPGGPRIIPGLKGERGGPKRGLRGPPGGIPRGSLRNGGKECGC